MSVTFEEGSERNKALGVLGAIAGSGAAIGLLLGGVLTEFAGWEWIFFVNVPIGSPLVDLRIFRRRTLTAANVIGLLLGTMLFGMFFLLSLYQQDVLGFSPLRTGVGNLAIALTVIAASTISQALVTRLGVKPADWPSGSASASP